MANIQPLGTPLSDRVQLRPEIAARAGLAIGVDNEDHDPALKLCRSMKPGPQGCKNFRWNDTDYCKKHYDMIAAEGNL